MRRVVGPKVSVRITPGSDEKTRINGHTGGYPRHLNGVFWGPTKGFVLGARMSSRKRLRQGRRTVQEEEEGIDSGPCPR